MHNIYKLHIKAGNLKALYIRQIPRSLTVCLGGERSSATQGRESRVVCA